MTDIGPDDPVPLSAWSDQKLRTRLVAERLKNTKKGQSDAETIIAEMRRRDSIPHKQEDKQGYVYFIQCGKRVKIGFTTNPEARISSLATGTPEPPVMLMWKPGTLAMERELHRRFIAFRVHREWFSLHGALLKFLRKEDCSV